MQFEAIWNFHDAFSIDPFIPKKNEKRSQLDVNDADHERISRSLDVEELMTLGSQFLYQGYTKKSFELAVAYFKRASELDYARAFLELAFCYRHGLGVKRSMIKAFECYQEGARLGNTNALIEVALCYLYGEGTLRNLKLAKNAFEIAAEQGDTFSMLHLRDMYHLGPGTNKAEALSQFYETSRLSILHKRAKEGHLGSILQLTHTTAFRDAGEDFKLELFHRVEKAAMREGNFAKWALAHFYAEGIGVKKNARKALSLIEGLLEAGCEWHQLSYVQMLLKLQLKIATALKLLKHLALGPISAYTIDQKSDALFLLGKLYEEGRCVEKSDTVAFKCYLQASDLGNVEAIVKMGDAYLEGRYGLKTIPKRACKYYFKAAIRDSAAAWYALGKCFSTGIGVEKSMKKASVCLERANYFDFEVNAVNKSRFYKK